MSLRLNDVTNMTVSTLKVSAGAICNFKEGDKLNMLTAQVLSVKNGDVFLDLDYQCVER